MEWVLGAVGFGIPLLQAQNTHQEQLRQADLHHDQAMRLDIELARRDILQEMRDQKADKLETLLVLDTLMLGCSFGIVVEGMCPRNTWPWFLIIFAITLSLSISMFFVSIWFVMKTQSRISRYNIMNPSHSYSCGKMHPTFHSFFNCHCDVLHRAAVFTYYAGVVFVILTGSMLFFARFMVQSHVPEAAWLFGVVLALFLVALIGFEYAFPSGPRLTEKDYQGHYSLQANHLNKKDKENHDSPKKPKQDPLANAMESKMYSPDIDTMDPDLMAGDHQTFLEKQSRRNTLQNLQPNNSNSAIN